MVAVPEPLAVFVADDGTLICGTAAERAGAADPTRLVHNFRGSLGDPSPILIDSAPYSAETLLAAVLASALTEAEQFAGRRPERVVVTCPVSWGAFRREQFDDVLVLAGASGCVVVSDAQVVARRWFDARGVAAGRRIAVFDVGGATVEAAVLESRGAGAVPHIIGVPVGSDRVGGDAIDGLLGQRLSRLSPQQVRVMKHELSDVQQSRSPDGDVISRGEFEELIRPLLRSALQVLSEAIRSAGADQLDAVLLIGGSARIPLLLSTVQSSVACPVDVIEHPDTVVALSAAELAADPAEATLLASSSRASVPSLKSTVPSRSAGSRWRSRAVLWAVAGVLVAVLVVIVLVNLGRGSGHPPVAGAKTTPRSSAVAATPARFFRCDIGCIDRNTPGPRTDVHLLRRAKRIPGAAGVPLRDRRSIPR
ncbi:Hsp70 family protein [Jatrophihabitans sp. GAS493]|uniref:Hsp70 family protein n=1 Tax=Jatrophihabitans sp. GAS493 TaxID=1907575 RepID=UPI00155FC1D8|nr:Hsp70 family protein [Jatrophihabitans sp. GAS493]